MNKILKLKKRPFLISLLGWILFPIMYLLIGILTSFGIPVVNSLLIGAPFGIAGFICWVYSFILSANYLLKSQLIKPAIGGLILSIIPLGFLLFAFWAVANGA